MSQLARRTNFADGMHCGAGNGVLVEIYDPPIWSLARWWKWFMIWLLNKPRCEITLVVDGNPLTVRAAILREAAPYVSDSNE